MMSDRQTSLKKLVVGDFFHASFLPECYSGPNLVFLVTAVSDISIRARTATTQWIFQFNRETGEAETIDEGSFISRENETIRCLIDSIAPLPVDVHNVMLGIDRKFRLESSDRNPERIKLNEAEKKALLLLRDHYQNNPL
jgi:hypothetical protein